jgi:hypothetical protein
VGGQLYVEATLTPEKEPLNRRLGRTEIRSRCFEELIYIYIYIYIYIILQSNTTYMLIQLKRTKQSFNSMT